MYIYQIFGFLVQSDIEIPIALNSSEDEIHKADIVICIGKMPKEILTAIEEGHQGCMYKDKRQWFYYKGEACYLIEDGKRIMVQPFREENTEPDYDIIASILGPCMGHILFQREVIAMHGSAVEINNKAIIISGISGSGKSTLTRELLLLGCKFMADDIVRVECQVQGCCAVPAYPQQKLCKDMAEANGYDISQLVLLNEERCKYGITYGEEYYDQPATLSTVYIIEQSDVNEYHIETIEGASKLQYIINNLYCIEKYRRLNISPKVLKKCLDIARYIEVKRVIRPKKIYTAKNIAKEIISTL